MCKKIKSCRGQITMHILDDCIYINCNRRSKIRVLELYKDKKDQNRPWKGMGLVCVPEGLNGETGTFVTFLCFPERYSLKQCEEIFFECESALADYSFEYLLRKGRRDSYVIREDCPLPRGYYVGDKTCGSFKTFDAAIVAGNELGVFDIALTA